MLHAANLISAFLPQTRAFRLRTLLYSWCGVNVAADCKINGGVVIQYPNIQIGSGTWIGRRTEFVPTALARITIGSNCDISQDVLFITGSHEMSDHTRRAGSGYSQAIEVGNGSWIGARSTFLIGSGVGTGCMVAAGSLVRDVFPSNVLIAGVPAKIVRNLDRLEDTALADG
jgi:maltose O-acetyltransferase